MSRKLIIHNNEEQDNESCYADYVIKDETSKRDAVSVFNWKKDFKRDCP